MIKTKAVIGNQSTSTKTLTHDYKLFSSSELLQSREYLTVKQTEYSKWNVTFDMLNLSFEIFKLKMKVKFSTQ